MEGEGFLVNRPFPLPQFSYFDPFLLLDEMGPMQLAPGEAKGAPHHPHRGFETVTYLLSGEFEHEDSRGNRGKLGPGDVQWMTAGRGVVHSEMPSKKIIQEGGKLHGLQLWVNLPKKDKMIEPRYQEIPKERIPEVSLGDKGKVRVISGEVGATSAVIETRIPIYFLDYTLNPGAAVRGTIPSKLNAFAYILSGSGKFGGDQRVASAHQMVIFDRKSDEFEVTAGAEPFRFLILAGEPINEPVARFGPFVMNTAEELEEAFRDYDSGEF
jgi:redox-sensitive bicupin YhaK (pirin superfamily)